jgi:predicted dehydrogenase
LESCKVTAVCDQSYDQLLRIIDRFPGVYPIENYDLLLSRSLVDAVIIATPTATHYDLAARALKRGLHVFVEKPLARTSDECRELIELADLNNCTLFVGHVFLHAAPVLKLKELIASDELGNINYISSRRLNLGPVRKDVSSLYDLAPHDISMMLYFLDAQPERVSCQGLDHLKAGVHDVCNLSMSFGGNRMGLVHVSWLDPRKERVLTIVGDKKMAVYDDLEQEKIKIYDKGIQAPSPSADYAEFQISYRYGGSYSPFIQEREPLKAECADFIRCIEQQVSPRTGGENGLRVVEVLEAAQKSLEMQGRPVDVRSQALV